METTQKTQTNLMLRLILIFHSHLLTEGPELS